MLLNIRHTGPLKRTGEKIPNYWSFLLLSHCLSSCCCLFLGGIYTRCTFLFHAKAQILTFYLCLFSLFLPRQERPKIGTSAATDKRREQTMAEQMITSESGKQQKFTVFRFVPPCWLFILDNLIPFVSVLPRWQGGKKINKGTDPSSKRSKSVISAWSRRRFPLPETTSIISAWLFLYSRYSYCKTACEKKKKKVQIFPPTESTSILICPLSLT